MSKARAVECRGRPSPCRAPGTPALRPSAPAQRAGHRPAGTLDKVRATRSPAAVVACLPPGTDAVAVRDGRRTVVAAMPSEVVSADGVAALAALDTLTPGWWAGFLTYDLGRAVERVTPRPPGTPGEGPLFPDLLLARFEARLVIDPVRGRSRVEGQGQAAELLRDTAARAASVDASVARPQLGPWSSSLSRAGFEDGVHAIKELLTAGECYQANLTRQLRCERAADPVTLLASLERHNPAPHQAMIRIGDLAVVSASPERFLKTSGRSVETRPMKGTGTNPLALSSSAEERAEHVMIVDLARNDLGRVCEFGSVEVPALCAVEAHPGLFQMVSTVRGVLRPDAGLGDLIRATFPPASVTGAPKPQVLQVIEDLEPVRRGVYCGAVGWLDTERDELDLAVAIRTFAISAGSTGVAGRPGWTALGVGSGIVADSDPASEWRETELKAARLLEAAGRRTPIEAAS